MFFFFNDTATTEIYPLSLHDALPISRFAARLVSNELPGFPCVCDSFRIQHGWASPLCWGLRSEEHTSELQSHLNLVCRLLLEKKKDTPASISNPLTKISPYT